MWKMRTAAVVSGFFYLIFFLKLNNYLLILAIEMYICHMAESVCGTGKMEGIWTYGL
jgi:hypothetical protein